MPETRTSDLHCVSSRRRRACSTRRPTSWPVPMYRRRTGRAARPCAADWPARFLGELRIRRGTRDATLLRRWRLRPSAGQHRDRADTAGHAGGGDRHRRREAALQAALAPAPTPSGPRGADHSNVPVRHCASPVTARRVRGRGNRSPWKLLPSYFAEQRERGLK